MGRKRKFSGCHSAGNASPTSQQQNPVARAEILQSSRRLPVTSHRNPIICHSSDWIPSLIDHHS
jgi:hypothetical protein